MRSLAEENVSNAVTVCKLIEEPSKLLSTILIGNNIVNILTSSLATVLATRHFGSAAVGLVTGVLTIMVLLFGEITPTQTDYVARVHKFPPFYKNGCDL